MEYVHKVQSKKVDLSSAVSRHSADETVVYKIIGESPLYLGIYYPQNYNKTNRYPVFLFIHGGAWSNKKVFDDQKHWQGDYLGFLARYYADKGFVSVSIDYRLAHSQGQTQNFGLIDCYEDCCDAIDYLQVHAEDYGLDMRSMYLLGESAGGHLAGAVATFHYDRRYDFQKVFLMNPITDMHDEKWLPYVPQKTFHTTMQNLSVKDRTIFLSPLYQADERVSPVVLVHGKADDVVDLAHSYRFYNRMNNLRRPCDLHIIENTHHAFILAEYTQEQKACELGVSIIDSYF